MFNISVLWEQMSIMDSVSGAGNSPFANLKKTTGGSSKLKLTFEGLNQQAIQVAFGLNKNEPQTLYNAMKAICVDAGEPFNSLPSNHTSADKLLNAIGQAVHGAQRSDAFNDTHREVAQNMYSLLKAARKLFGGTHDVFSGFKRDQRGEYQTALTQTEESTTVYKDESRIKSEDKRDDQFNQTAWTSYFKDVLAFQETVDAPKTSDLEVLGKKVTAEESQKILVRLGVRAKGQQVSLDQVNAHWESPVKKDDDSEAIQRLKFLIQQVKPILSNRGLADYGGWADEDSNKPPISSKLQPPAGVDVSSSAATQTMSDLVEKIKGVDDWDNYCGMEPISLDHVMHLIIGKYNTEAAKDLLQFVLKNKEQLPHPNNRLVRFFDHKRVDMSLANLIINLINNLNPESNYNRIKLDDACQLLNNLHELGFDLEKEPDFVELHRESSNPDAWVYKSYGVRVSPLYLATRKKHIGVIQTLLDLGMDPYRRSSNGLTTIDSMIGREYKTKYPDLYDRVMRMYPKCDRVKEFKKIQKDVASVQAHQKNMMTKFIEKSAFIEGVHELTQEKLAELITKRELIIDPQSTTLKDMKFFNVNEKIYIGKKNGVESEFGTTLFRYLSNKHYASKAEVLYKDDEGVVWNLSKYDDDINKEKKVLHPYQRFKPNVDVNAEDTQNFMEGYARMMGVLLVLGENDTNPNNYFVNKNGKPVKIDNSFLVNLQPRPFLTRRDSHKNRFRILGCGQAKYFFNVLLCGEDPVDIDAEIKDKNKVAMNNKTDDLNFYETFSKGMRDVFMCGISDEKCQVLKSRMQDYPRVRIWFEAFIAGVKDAIALSENEEFMDAYLKRYEGSRAIADICRGFLQENCKEIKSNLKEVLNLNVPFVEKQGLEVNLESAGWGSKPEAFEAFHLNQLLEVLIASEFEEHPNIDPPITYFDCDTLQKYLAYCKALNSDEDKKLRVWETLEASIKDHVTNDNYTCPQYFSKMIMALNLAIAKKSQENEAPVGFDPGSDKKYEPSDWEGLIPDPQKADTGFGDPEVQTIGNVSVSICEVNGRNQTRAQEDQYHVGPLDVDPKAAPSELKAILAACETKALEQNVGNSGSTATLTHISTTGMLTVASVGDAPALFLAKNKTTGELTMVPLTRDHEPNHFFEQSRIINNKGVVIKGRVLPSILNLTRAIGDFVAKTAPSEMVISNEPDVVQFDASLYLEGHHEVCVLTACDGILDHGKATRQNYATLFGSKKDGEARNFSQRCVSYALNCGSTDNITATAAEFTALPTQGVLLGVFDGHGGKETSKICKDTVAVRCAGS